MGVFSPRAIPCACASENAPGHPEVLGFGDARAEENRVDLRNRDEQRAFAAPDEVAGLDLRRPDEAVERRADRGVAEVEFGLLESRLRGVHLGDRCVPGRGALSSSCWLTACCAARGVRRATSLLDFSSRACDVARLAFAFATAACNGLGSILYEQLPLAHQRTFREGHRFEEALDAGPDLDVLEAHGLAHQLHVDGTSRCMGSVTITSGGGGAAGGASFEHAEAARKTRHRKRIGLRIITRTSLTQGRNDKL